MHETTPLLPDSEGLFPFYWRTVLRPYLGKAFCLAILMLLGALLQMGAIGLTVPALEVVSAGAAANSRLIEYFRDALTAIGIEPSVNVVTLSILLCSSVLFVLYSGVTMTNAYFSAAIGESLRRTTRLKLFDEVISARYETVLQPGRGAILHDLTDPPWAVQMALTRLSMLCTAIFNSAVLLLLMLYLSWWATAFVGVLGLVAVHGTRRFTETRARQAGKAINSLNALESQLIIDAVDGLKISKAHGLEKILFQQLQHLLESEVRPALRVAMFRHLPAFINEFAAGAIVIVLSGVTLLMPSRGLSFPILVAFLVAIRQCGASIATVSSTLVDLQSLRARVSVVGEMSQRMPREQSGTVKPTAVSDLTLRNVSFQYVSRGDVLRNLNITLKKGTVTAIVGSTGSGKSTIANLIVGLHLPSSGSILVDGVDLKGISLSEWRRRIGYVPQDPFLFNTSIRNNIALWDETIGPSEIEHAARLAQLHEFVERLPGGYDTTVGDHGLELSGGQAQRVAIARAILRKPEILVLDEATSALDNLTEQAVYEAVSALRSSAIVLIIAHRLSTVRDADRIILLDAGKVVESGTHEALMRNSSSYSRLYSTEATRG